MGQGGSRSMGTVPIDRLSPFFLRHRSGPGCRTPPRARLQLVRLAGFEPTIPGPWPGALPLGHSRVKRAASPLASPLRAVRCADGSLPRAADGRCATAGASGPAGAGSGTVGTVPTVPLRPAPCWHPRTFLEKVGILWPVLALVPVSNPAETPLTPCWKPAETARRCRLSREMYAGRNAGRDMSGRSEPYGTRGLPPASHFVKFLRRSASSRAVFPLAYDGERLQSTCRRAARRPRGRVCHGVSRICGEETRI